MQTARGKEAVDETDRMNETVYWQPVVGWIDK